MSSSSQAHLSSGNSPSSTLRPRTTRLISYLEEDEGEDHNTLPEADRGAAAISTSSSSIRHASPASGLRTSSGLRKSGKQASESGPVGRDIESSRRGSGANGLWNSWTQIQGIASTILGSDPAVVASNASRARSGAAFKTPAWMKQDRTAGAATSSQKWGPRAPDRIGTGSDSIEGRQTMLQAKKREALLLAATHEGKDASGRFKRKGSDASLSVHSPSLSDDVLVYRHKVLPDDTMAGITIKYSCQQEIFRKVNRLWPNDRVQIRDYVLLPVDACAVRGRKLDPSAGDELPKDILSGVHNPTKSRELTTSSRDRAPAMSPVYEERSDEYKHDSWVSLPNFPSAVEILRIPRTTLGYFPPARRKSNHDLLAVDGESAISSARASFDTLRHPPTHAAQQAQLQQQNLRSVSTDIPSQQPGWASNSMTTATRHRSHSTATTSSQQTSAAANQFFSALRGPGGVGSLRGLRTESSRPGPADDPLNQKFAKYLPSLAIAIDASGDDSHSANYPLPQVRPFVSAQTLGLPRASMESLRSSRSGRSNSSASAFGAGVENWVKKIASASATMPGLSRTNSDRTIGPNGKHAGLGLGGETGLGDLIELETNPDAHDFLSHSTESHPRQGDDFGVLDTPRPGDAMSRLNPSSSVSTTVSTGPQSDQDHLLNERFPIRGKVTKAYGAKK